MGSRKKKKKTLPFITEYRAQMIIVLMHQSTDRKCNCNFFGNYRFERKKAQIFPGFMCTCEGLLLFLWVLDCWEDEINNLMMSVWGSRRI